MRSTSHAAKSLQNDEKVSCYLRCIDFYRTLMSDSNDGTCHRSILFLACLLIICAITAFTGAVPHHKYGHDAFFLLDNGWRVVNGQRPHLDYTSAWGPLTFMIVALGLKLSRFTADGIGYGNAIFAFLIGLWCYRLGRYRLEFPARLILSLFLVGLVVAPYALGAGVFESNHAMLYNRYGYALLGLIILEAFQPVQDPLIENEEWIGGISSGSAVALTLFLKASYFIVALLLLFGFAIIFLRFDRRRMLGFILGFFLVTVAFLAYLDFDIQAIFNDLRMAAGARSESLSFSELIRKFDWNKKYLIVVILLGIVSQSEGEHIRFQWRDLRLSLTGSLVFLADILLLFTNWQEAELPLLAVFTLIVFQNITVQQRKRQGTGSRLCQRCYLTFVLLGGFLFLPCFASQFVALAHGALEKYQPSNLQSIVPFSEPRLKSLLLYDGGIPRSNGRQYTSYVNDGVALLRKATKADETVINMDMVNPFPYALGRRPALGGIAAVAYNFTLSDRHKPSDKDYFGNANIVMLPKRPSIGEGFYNGFLRIYEPELHRSFYLVAESDWWYLYRRK